MKCNPHVSPLWKNPAANGPWYQVESNPVIPVDSRALTPTAKWTTATAAISRAISSVGDGGRECPSVLLGFSPGESAAGRPRGWGEKQDAAAPEGHPHPLSSPSRIPEPMTITAAMYGAAWNHPNAP